MRDGFLDALFLPRKPPEIPRKIYKPQKGLILLKPNWLQHEITTVSKQ